MKSNRLKDLMNTLFTLRFRCEPKYCLEVSLHYAVIGTDCNKLIECSGILIRTKFASSNNHFMRYWTLQLFKVFYCENAQIYDKK